MDWSVLNFFYHNKKTLFHQFFTIIGLSPISKKNPNYLILVLLRCSILDNGRENPSVLHPKTDQSNIAFTGKDIEEVIQHLDSNKAQGHGMISIRVLKICVKSIIKPLLILYKKCLEKFCFPKKRKKANVVPAHKKMTINY